MESGGERIDDPLRAAGLSARHGRMGCMTGRLHGVVIDCPDPDALAAFYQRLLGMVRVTDHGG